MRPAFKRYMRLWILWGAGLFAVTYLMSLGIIYLLYPPEAWDYAVPIGKMMAYFMGGMMFPWIPAMIWVHDQQEKRYAQQEKVYEKIHAIQERCRNGTLTEVDLADFVATLGHSIPPSELPGALIRINRMAKSMGAKHGQGVAQSVHQ